MTKKPAWSFSSLNQYYTCPKQYYHLRVAKDFKDTPGEAALDGQIRHKHLENRILHGTPLPSGTSQFEPIVSKMLETPHDAIHAEKQYCLNSDFQPVEWFSKDAWVRGVIDVELRKNNSVVVADWKFGKRKPDSDQLKLFAALVMTADPEVDKVSTAFFWLKERKVDRDKFTRADVPEIWQYFLARYSHLELAYANDKWIARPSGLCKNYCVVTSCPYNGKRK